MAPNLVSHLWGVTESVAAKSFHYQRGFNQAEVGQVLGAWLQVLGT